MANTYDELYVPLSYYLLHNEGNQAGKAGDQPAKKPGKKPVINKSSLIIDIKPYGEETNLDEVLKLVKGIEMEGLTWGKAHKKMPFAFGLFKLQVSCVIVDDLINTDELIEMIENVGLSEEDVKKKKELQELMEGEELDEEVEGLVQSAEIISFNKL
ncbi:elongation factor 1, putative [Plasmodium knowlesi strain H]|uniref:Elongation factor 1, putative n=3 Tax=Plasmodium knowlesi TaxID=5850 RepID=A0A5K1U8S4_PLAKH|nr:elongation factor 1-delta, putative [Plasmodium knowlesi strain H]OTN66017.1 putative Elongation factor 1 [Plasmodium knowlesi]CAA9987859.1 elongation factor 1-delta, putative [Plasmodium knowlesi strain H]SBO22308.1 elongation factor 1, putative [Plasmodium knowlesi strain H]SBO28792.1 elongation factor 1, putative [Plasmodium knowlesi strain H]VVS77333.1 elongation factor 1-delta, putative [Plasmodium knowlesi strain H]|eukprot:XP_002258857.1 elongation factor 1, putative [Plasmodium knowlesi strain H]